MKETESERHLREAHDACGDATGRIEPQPPGSGDYWLNGVRTEIKQFDWSHNPELGRDERADRVKYKLQDAARQKAIGILQGRDTFDQLEIDTTGTDISRGDVERGIDAYVAEMAQDVRLPKDSLAYDVRHSHEGHDDKLNSGMVMKRDELNRRVAQERQREEVAKIRYGDLARIERAKRLSQRGRDAGRGRER
jgi:hypothetical protein